MMSPFGAIAHAVGPMNVSVPAFETPALPSDSSTLPSGLNLNNWKPRPFVAGLSWNGPLSPAQKLPSRS